MMSKAGNDVEEDDVDAVIEKLDSRFAMLELSYALHNEKLSLESKEMEREARSDSRAKVPEHRRRTREKWETSNDDGESPGEEENGSGNTMERFCNASPSSQVLSNEKEKSSLSPLVQAERYYQLAAASFDRRDSLPDALRYLSESRKALCAVGGESQHPRAIKRIEKLMNMCKGLMKKVNVVQDVKR